MVEVQLLDRLRALALRKRWIIGLAVGRRCTHLHAALVGVEGAGLASRVEIFAHHRLPVRREVTLLFKRLRTPRKRAPAAVGLLAAQLAECQAALLDEFSAQIASVWDRVLAVAVDDPGLWRSAGGLTGYVSLCDAARLAELSGLNVIDAFPARDVAQEGRGRPLLPIPNWLLLHDLQKTRVLVEWGRTLRLTYVPGSRDASGASRVMHLSVTIPEETPQAVAEAIVQAVQSRFPPMPRIGEILLHGPEQHQAFVAEHIGQSLGDVRVRALADLGIEPKSLKPAGVAILGLLHLDQVPANATTITGARAARLLGRLTPGSLANWNRLLRELAGAKPSVVSLRSAV